MPKFDPDHDTRNFDYYNDPDDYRFSQEAAERDLKMIYECDACGREIEVRPDEGVTRCDCGGSFSFVGETHNA